MRAGEVGSSEELKEGCVLGMLQSLRVEGEQSASTTEEKECSSGSGIPLASTRLFFLFLSLVPSFFFFFSLLGPQIFPWFLGLPKGTLSWSQMGEACSGDPFCSNMDIPL